MKKLASDIYNILQDLDFLDYAETAETDLQALQNDLELLQKSGNGALLTAIKLLLEN